MKAMVHLAGTDAYYLVAAMNREYMASKEYSAWQAHLVNVADGKGSI